MLDRHALLSGLATILVASIPLLACVEAGEASGEGGADPVDDPVEEPNDPVEQPNGTAGQGSTDDSSRTCEEVKSDMDELLRAHSSCSEGDVCEVVRLCLFPGEEQYCDGARYFNETTIPAEEYDSLLAELQAACETPDACGCGRYFGLPACVEGTCAPEL